MNAALSSGCGSVSKTVDSDTEVRGSNPDWPPKIVESKIQKVMTIEKMNICMLSK